MSKYRLFGVIKGILPVAALSLVACAGAIPPDPCNPPPLEVCCDTPAPGPYAFAFERDIGLSCPTNFFVNAELLVMQPRMEGLEYAIENSSHSNAAVLPLHDGDFDGFSTKNHKWEWNYGFRAQMGFLLNHDRWMVDFGWTYLKLKADDSDNIRGTGSLVPLWLPPTETLNPGTIVSARWSGDLNALDLRLGKPFHVSRYLVMNPYMGLRTAWIEQKFLARQFGTFTFGQSETVDPEMDAENDFWGIGARTGIDTEWMLNGGWKLLGNLSGSILYGKFDVTQQIALVGNQIELHHEFYTHVPTLDLALGVAWGQLFGDDKYAFDIALTYEFHEWFNQNRMRRFLDSSRAIASNMEVSNGDLSYSGFALKLQFDF